MKFSHSKVSAILVAAIYLILHYNIPREVLPIMAPPKSGTVFRLPVDRRVEISLKKYKKG